MENKKPNNPSAFPQLSYEDRVGGIGHFTPLNDGGMTLRDYFAAKAMQEVLSENRKNVAMSGWFTGWDYDEISDHAYNIAEAMLKRREK